MKSTLATLLLSAALVCCGAASNVGYKYLGRILTTNPAFVKVEKFPGQPEFLLIASFAAFSSGKVSVIPNIGQAVKAAKFDGLVTHVLADSFKWPNSVEPIPQDVFGAGLNAIIVPDGFLPPGKTNGNIYVLATGATDVTKGGAIYQLSAQKPGFFYHTGVWLDVDGDGRKDYITARSNAKADGGELVWYKHPEGGLQSLPWPEQVITAGPDVMFEIDEVTADSFVVFAAEFFNKKLTAYKVALGSAKVLASRVIDDHLDQAYSVRYVDVDGDGQKDLLVNNHESDNAKAAIFLYQVPADVINGAYPRKTIASGFKNARSLFVPNMCPGFPYVVQPVPGAASHILVAGDGDYSAHLMRPDGTGNFTMELVKNLGGTVGSIAVYDFDGDGVSEFFVPNYDNNYIEVYTFTSTAASEFLQ